MWHLNRIYLILTFSILINKGFTQPKPVDTTTYKIIAAGPEYKKSRSYQKLWGRNRRAEWTTQVRVPMLWLNSLHGKLSLSKSEGGNETKVLRVTVINDGKERDYTLRSINKSRDDVVPKEFEKTFVEDHIQDGVSMSHPYGAYALPGMEQAAGIYHTNPKLVYLPKQAALDTLNDEFGNDLYMFEQRISGDWSDAANLGNFKDFIGTDELVDSIKNDNRVKADQHAFVRARLFDLLIADWDRHEDQWKWGAAKSDNFVVYKPIPRDRDQVFYTHDGILIDRVLPAIGNGYMLNFDHDSKNISALNFEERNIDPFFTNEMDLDDWVNEAKRLQQALTDHAIEQSLRLQPPEIFAVSGQSDIAKLKSRREQLVKYATEYYLFLAKEIEIVGSKKRESFEIAIAESGNVSVRINALNNDGKNLATRYERTFKPAETETIRIFGIGGEDTYTIKGATTSISLSIIGGPDKDVFIQHADTRIKIYDNRDNDFQVRSAKMRLSSDSDVHTYEYRGHEWNKKGFVPALSFNDDDRFYVGLAYGFTTYKWRRKPFATKQSLDLHYSISQRAISLTYMALYPNAIGKWNITLLGNYDAIRWTNFFGLGNETVYTNKKRNFYLTQAVDVLGSVGINRQFGKSTIYLSGYYQSVRIKPDPGRYITTVFAHIDEDVFKTNNYAGGKFTYTFASVNDSIVPTKGITFFANASIFNNTVQDESFQKYFGLLKFFIPLGNKFSIAVKAGATTIVSNDEVLNGARFYEHAVIGGPDNLRGFRLHRFWGKSAYYNNNELRYITDLRTHLLNAKVGLLVFYDNGRVWMPNELSNTIHTAYGAGVLIAPFKKVSLTFSYGISKESKLFQGVINTLF